MTNVGKEINEAIKKTGRGRYERMKSEPGGIQDQMNCMWHFMQGYLSVNENSDSSLEQDDGKLCITAYKTRVQQKVNTYLNGSAQWQIHSIEECAKKWKMTLVELFRISEYVYAYCPSYTGTKDDFKRMFNLGVQTADFGSTPMAVLEMGKLKKVNELKAQIEEICATIGKTVELKLKNKED